MYKISMDKIKNSVMELRIRKDLFVWFSVLVVMATMAVGDVEQGPLIARTDGNVNVGENVCVDGELQTEFHQSIYCRRTQKT